MVSSSLPLISVVCTDVNLQTVLIFVLLTAELASHCRGRDVLVDDVLHEVCPPVTLLAADCTTKHLVPGLNDQTSHTLVIPEI